MHPNVDNYRYDGNQYHTNQERDGQFFWMLFQTNVYNDVCDGHYDGDYQNNPGKEIHA